MNRMAILFNFYMSVHGLIISYLASKVDANLSEKHCQIKYFNLIYAIIRLYENTNATIVDILDLLR